MRPRVAASLAVSVWLVVLGLLLVPVAAGPSGTQDQGTVANLVTFLVFVLAFSSVGALVAAKRPSNPIGWVLLGAALFYTVGGLGTSVNVPSGGQGLSAAELAFWASQWAWGVGVGLAVAVLLVFPNGRLPSRWWRPVLWADLVGMLAFVLGLGFGAGSIGGGHVPNPFAVPGPLGRALSVLQGAFPLVLLAAALAVASIVVRFVRARGAERQQVKWLFYTVVLFGLGLAGQWLVSVMGSFPDAVTNAQNAIATGTLALVPVAIGIAVLRHRLYDIDRIINRTLVYALLTAVLVGIYAGLVLGLEAVAGSDNAVVVAGSTLVVAALFNPLRRRLQSLIDRRFYRRKYDAEQTLDAFGSRLRDEVDLDELRAHMLAVVGETVQPAHASVWLAGGRR